MAGTSLRKLVETRRATGNFVVDIDTYIAAAKQSISRGEVFGSVVEIRGRSISISNRPMPDGGWVATHEDITERQRRAQPPHPPPRPGGPRPPPGMCPSAFPRR